MKQRTQLGVMTEETKRLLQEWQKEADKQSTQDMYKDKEVCREYEEWLNKYDTGFIGESGSL